MGGSVTTLRIRGDDLIISEVSALLGCDPTRAIEKGEPAKGWPRNSDGRADSGRWSLDIRDKSISLDQQVSALLGRVTSDLNVWKKLSEKYHIDIFCGYFMNEDRDGYSLSPSSMRALADRNLVLHMCLYTPD